VLLKEAVLVVISLVKTGTFGWLLVWLKRGSFGWLLV